MLKHELFINNNNGYNLVMVVISVFFDIIIINSTCIVTILTNVNAKLSFCEGNASAFFVKEG